MSGNAAKTAFAEAVAAHRAGDLPRAKSLYRMAAASGRDPGPPRLLALLLAEEGDPEAARHWAREALGRDPDAFESHLALGRIQSIAGAWTEAAESYGHAVARDPHSAAAHLGLGRSLVASGQAPAACDCLAMALRLRPDDPRIRHAYAAALGADAEMTRAEQACAAFPLVGEVRHALGQKLFAARRFADAARVLAEAAALLPASAEVRHDLGTALHEARRPAEAAPVYRDALAREPGRVDTWHNLASSLQAIGDVDGALRCYARAYRLDRTSFPRIAQELAAGNPGKVWLRAADLRNVLIGLAADELPAA